MTSAITLMSKLAVLTAPGAELPDACRPAVMASLQE
jgi:hypothetical protein